MKKYKKKKLISKINNQNYKHTVFIYSNFEKHVIKIINILSIMKKYKEIRILFL